MKVRAATLLVVMLLTVLVLALMLFSAVSTFDGHSLVALCVVLVVAAAGGIAFSWKRYYRR
jgi:hypothetical protein